MDWAWRCLSYAARHENHAKHLRHYITMIHHGVIQGIVLIVLKEVGIKKFPHTTRCFDYS